MTGDSANVGSLYRPEPTPRDQIARARENGCDDPAKYVDANPLRALICDLAGLDVGDRFCGDDRVALKKDHLREIAYLLSRHAEGASVTPKSDEEVDALSLKALLEYVCVIAGSEYAATAGIQWALTKDNLKAIYYALESLEVLDDEGEGEGEGEEVA